MSQRHWFGLAAILAATAAIFLGRYISGRTPALPPDLARRQEATPSDTGRLQYTSADRLATAESERQQSVEDQSFSPSSDGWETESFVGSAKKQLLAILEPLRDNHQVTQQTVAPFVTADVICQPLRPKNLREVLTEDSIVIRRAAGESEPTAKYRGPDQLATAIRDLVSPFGLESKIEFHLKLHGVTTESDSIVTRVDFESHGHRDGGMIQQNATWICSWTTSRSEAPRLKAIVIENFEEIVTNPGVVQSDVARPDGGTWFVDCTEAILGNNASFHEQLVFGLNHWMQRVDRTHGLQIYARTGLAVGDVNGDGLDDVYLCQPGGLPNRLFVQNPDGTATDVSHDARVDWLDESHGALLVDLDNDGDQDLALACTAGIILMENNGTGKFKVRRHVRAGRSVQSLSAADYDSDGDLDLYACVYRASSETQAAGEAVPEFLYHDANDGGMNRMLRNDLSDRAWVFTDVTRECGLDQSNRRWSLASCWEDFDNDGDQDLYVANDYGQNCLYRNDEGRFIDIAAKVGVVDFGSGMSVSWGDYDRDGWMDLYVGNMFSAAGNRIAVNSRFMTDSNESTRAIYQRFAKGNSLFKNVGGKEFREVGSDAAVEMARWAWSSLFSDINNDGWQDLVVANGFITADDDRDL